MRFIVLILLWKTFLGNLSDVKYYSNIKVTFGGSKLSFIFLPICISAIIVNIYFVVVYRLNKVKK